jgi:hypothetical protein
MAWLTCDLLNTGTPKVNVIIRDLYKIAYLMDFISNYRGIWKEEINSC